MLDYAHIARSFRGLTFIAAALVSASLGCGEADNEGESGMAGARMDSASSRFLEVRPSEDEVDVAAGAEIALVAKLTDSEGEPISETTVNFALSGDVKDSSLQALSVLTDDSGTARNTIRAGTSRAEFIVRVSAASADAVSVHIKVSPEGLGTLVVNAAYSGDRLAQTRMLSIYANQDCQALAEARRDGTALRPRYVSELEAEVDALSIFLPAGDDYVVQAEALGLDGMVLAVACQDDISLTSAPDKAVTVELEWTDAPLTLESDFEVRATLDTGVPAEHLATTVKAAMDERLTDTVVLEGRSVDVAPAAHLLAALVRTMDARNIDAGEVSTFEGAPQLTAADITELELSLQDALDDKGVGPDRVAKELSERLQSGLSSTDLRFWLRISKGVAGDDPDDEVAGDNAQIEVYPVMISSEMIDQTRMPPSFELGLEPIVVDMVSLDGGSGELSFEALSLPLPLSSLAYLSLSQLAGVRDDSGANSWLKPLGCGVLQSWWADAQPTDVACDEGCVHMACERALGSLVAAAGDRLDPDPAILAASAEAAAAAETDDDLGAGVGIVEMKEPVVILDGVFALVDADGDLAPDSVMSKSLDGVWEPGDNNSFPLSGEAEGQVADFASGPQ